MNLKDEAFVQKWLRGIEGIALSASSQVALEQFRKRQPVHAYLLSGAQGLGKESFAKVLVCALFCTAEGQKPCGVCGACKSILHEQNPDVFLITPEKNRQIGVEKVREVIEAISQYAFGAGYRVVVIKPVEKLTPQAQNCLLKSLEEPASNVVFLLLAHEMTALLGTIASRCARVKLMPWPDGQMQAALEAQGYNQAEILRTLPAAAGNIGQALEMLEEKDQAQEVQAFLEQALALKSDADVVRASTAMKDGKENAEQCLRALEQAIHQTLLVRTGQLSSASLVGFPMEWQKAADSATVEGLTDLLKAIFEARRLRARQVNWQSNIDHLMIKILEEQRKWQQLLA